MVWARARAQDEDALFQERRAVASFFRTFALWAAAAARGTRHRPSLFTPHSSPVNSQPCTLSHET